MIFASLRRRFRINVTLQYTAARLTAFAKVTAVCTPLCVSDAGIGSGSYIAQILSTERLGSNPHLALIAKWRVERDLSPVELERLKSVLTDYPADVVRAELAEELRWIMGERKLATVTPLSVEDVRQARQAVEFGLTPFVVQDGH